MGVELINIVKVYGVLIGNKKLVWEEVFFLGILGRINIFGFEKELEVGDFE